MLHNLDKFKKNNKYIFSIIFFILIVNKFEAKNYENYVICS